MSSVTVHRVFDNETINPAMKQIIIILILYCLGSMIPLEAQVFISEVSPANGTILDRNHTSSDWCEITAKSSSVTLKGWRISDRNNFDNAFVLPDTVLKSGQAAMIYCNQNTESKPITTLIGDGAWIGRWSFWERNTFAYIPMSGDFTMSVRINSIHHDSVPTEAVLLIRENTHETSRYIGISALSNKFTIIHNKPSVNPNNDGMFFTLQNYPVEAKFPNCWLKLQKKGDTISLSASADGYYWAEEKSYYFPFTHNEYFAGIAIAPTNYVYSKNIRLDYSELMINDKEYPNGFPLIANIKTNKPASQSQNKEIHVPFQLSASRETLYLWNPEGKLIDTLSWANITGNRSWGRDSLGQKGYVFTATPGYKNSKIAEGICTMPELDEGSGVKNSPFLTKLSNISDSEIIHFTTNNEDPDETSPILPLDSMLFIEKTTTIRLRKYRSNYIPSQIQTYTYIFENKQEYPTIFLTAPDKLWWGDSIGILYDSAGKTNAYSNVEIPVSIEYIKNNKREFYENAGCSLRGSYSRELPQKAFDIDFRNKYGISSLKYNLYNKKNDEYSKFMLRNGGQDWWSTSIRDNIAATLAHDIGIDYQAFSPTRVFINGRYWGHYTIQENSGDEYISSNYGLDKDDFSIVGIYGNPLHGNSKKFNKIFSNIENSDFTIDSVFNNYISLFDKNQLALYTVLQIFTGNREFPGNNVKLWYDNDGKMPFRFILYDTDLAQASIWDYYYNSYDYLLSPEKMNWSNPPASTLLWRKLFSNISWRNSFFLALSDELNGHLSANNYIRIIDSLTSIVENEMQNHRKRWPMITTDWHHEVQRLREFATVRQDIVRQQSIQRFGLGGVCSLSVAVHPVNARGTVKVSKSISTSQSQQAVFFQDVPLPLSISEQPQWKFLHWRVGDSIISTDKNAIIRPDTISMNIIAEFVQDSTTMGNAIPIVINEIMYKAADSKDMKDWIELTNYGNESYNIGSWIIRDDDNSHSFIIPPNTIIHPQEYIVIAEDTSKFLQYYPRPKKLLGEFDFGFGRGDQVRLFNDANILMDSVRYGIIAPWDNKADGTGHSLELKSPDLDNTLPEHWFASGDEGGTPGRPNTPNLFVFGNENSNEISIIANHTSLEIYRDDSPESLQCSLYSIHGNLLTHVPLHSTQTLMSLTAFPSGVYTVIIQDLRTLRIIHQRTIAIVH